MKFIHIADLHLGRIFYGHHLIDDQEYLLNQIVDLVKQEKPNVLLVSGDVYDRASPPPLAVELLNNFLTKIIKNNKTPVIMIAGNHDSPTRMEFGSNLFHNFFVRGSIHKTCEPVILNDEYGKVYFYPLPFTEPMHLRLEFELPKIKTHNDAMKYFINEIKNNHPEKERAILLAHCFVQNAQISDSERTLSIGGADMVDASLFSMFNYTALGHLHRPQNLKNKVYYSGSLMKYSLSEYNHSKSINLVKLNKNGETEVQIVELNTKRDLQLIKGKFNDILEKKITLENDFKKNNFYYIRLENETPVLDAVNKLRKIYPNIVHLDYLNKKEAKIDRPDFSFAKMDTLKLFDDFFKSVHDRSMNAKEETIISDSLNTINAMEREQ